MDKKGLVAFALVAFIVVTGALIAVYMGTSSDNKHTTGSPTFAISPSPTKPAPGTTTSITTVSSTEVSTGSPAVSSTETSMAEVVHDGDISLQYLFGPEDISYWTTITKITGELELSNYRENNRPLKDWFPNLQVVGGQCAVTYATYFSDALQNLQEVQNLNIVLGYMATLENSFENLYLLGRNNHLLNPSLVITGNPNLQTLGTAFASLRRIPGRLLIQDNPSLTNFTALSNLECHGGFPNDDSTTYCQNCPNWLINKPQCCGDEAELIQCADCSYGASNNYCNPQPS